MERQVTFECEKWKSRNWKPFISSVYKTLFFPGMVTHGSLTISRRKSGGRQDVSQLLSESHQKKYKDSSVCDECYENYANRTLKAMLNMKPLHRFY